jgi:hypothetical protein
MALAAELNQAEETEQDALLGSVASSSTLATLTTGITIWAGTCTLILFIIIAVVFKQLRKQKTWDTSPPSHFSDAESAVSESSGKDSYDTCSVVDVDITGVGEDSVSQCKVH